jgi:hypothetical protein
MVVALWSEIDTELKEHGIVVELGVLFLFRVLVFRLYAVDIASYLATGSI